jgi:hypothetical protein
MKRTAGKREEREEKELKREKIVESNSLCIAEGMPFNFTKLANRLKAVNPNRYMFNIIEMIVQYAVAMQLKKEAGDYKGTMFDIGSNITVVWKTHMADKEDYKRFCGETLFECSPNLPLEGTYARNELAFAFISAYRVAFKNKEFPYHVYGLTEPGLRIFTK